jgi:tetratricopeptide (TPR) repeat protein
MGERSPTGKTSGHSSPATGPQSELPLPFESWDSDDRDETVRVSALDEQELSSPDPHIALTLHKRIARKLLEDGDVHRAFGELIRAAQTIEIDAELAYELARIARSSGYEVAAAAALDIAAPRAIPEHRNEVRRCAARLFRRLGRFPQARAILNAGLEEDPGDRRTRRLLWIVALHEGNYELAAEELEREVDDDELRGRHRQARRSALALARLLQEQLFDPEGAARAYARAAESAQNGNDAAACFSARAGAVRALAASKASTESLEAALAAMTEAARAANREAEASAIAAEVGASPEPQAAGTPAELAEAALARGSFEEAESILRKAIEDDPSDAALADKLESCFRMITGPLPMRSASLPEKIEKANIPRV